MADNTLPEDNIQHGLDDNPNHDPEKGAVLGGLGGAAVGAAAGSLAGPIGTLVGAVAGGLMGAGASGLAVSAVDQIDNDNTVSGIGDGVSPDVNQGYLRAPSSIDDNVRSSSDAPVSGTGVGGHNVVTGDAATTGAGNTGLAAGAIAGGLIGTAVGGPVGAVIGGVAGSLAGGVAGDAVEASDDRTALGGDAVDFDAAADYGAAPDVPVSNVHPATHPTSLSSSGTADLTSRTHDADPNEYGDRTYNAQNYEDQAGYGGVNDATLAPSPQTDYRNVDQGLTSVGATDTNADLSTAGDLGVPGVRMDPSVREGESSRGGDLNTGVDEGSGTRGQHGAYNDPGSRNEANAGGDYEHAPHSQNPSAQ